MVSTHHQNFRFPAIEMFNVFKVISLLTVKEIFQFKDPMPYKLRKHKFLNPTCILCCQWHRKYKIYGDLLHKSPYSIQIQENKNQK